MWQKTTRFARGALFRATSYALTAGTLLVDEAHILRGLLVQEKSCRSARILDRMGVDLGAIDKIAAEQSGRGNGPLIWGEGIEPKLAQGGEQVVDRAYALARKLGDDQLSSDHLLLALLDRQCRLVTVLADARITRRRVLYWLRRARQEESVG